MRDLNILFCLRRDFAENPGGDTVQMQSWAKALRALGNRVRIHSGAVKDDGLRGVDAIFVWHLERLHESFQPWTAAKRLRIPTILVPTYWRQPSGSGLGRSLGEQMKLWCRRMYHGRDAALQPMLFRSWLASRTVLLKHSSLLVVNSEAERELLLAEGAAAEKLIIVPNVIETDEIDAISLPALPKRQGAICVGHFCPRKNQLGLIRALHGTGLKITFIGSARPMHKRYFQQCVKQSGGQHEFIAALPHRETLELTARSRVSICASVSETPGICNLEAAALDCVLVLPDIAPVKEYFGNAAIYIRPDKIEPQKIIAAMQAEPSSAQRESVRENYTRKNIEAIFAQLQLPEASCVKKS